MSEPTTPDAPKPRATLLIKSSEFQGKNTPFTRFRFAERLRLILLQELKDTFVTEKNFNRHFLITCSNDGVRVVSLSDEASGIVESMRAGK